MTRGRTSGRNLGLASLVFLAVLGRTAGVRAQEFLPPGAPAFEGGEILTRGPVHEAFAEPVVFNPAAGLVVPKAPPGPVEELPPDQKPEGDDVEWVPGYWQWDDDRQDYLWVSGIWRVMPPGRSWVPGYWQQMGGGFQWVSGYWVPTAQQAVEYLPPPPASLEIGPNIPPPAPQGFVWTPGHWFWAEGRYVWRPGMWVQAYPDWIWVPAAYAYTPGGYVFVPGYWDHALDRRGMLFAPVYFNQPVYTQPAYVFTPSVSISLALLTSNFFARPSCGHYYFGDYYASSYRTAGYEPWFQTNRGNLAYDPIYAWSAATYTRRDPAWSTQVRETYRYRVDNLDARPARTYFEQERMLSRRQDPGVRELAIARPLVQEARAEGSPLRFQRIDQARRVEFARREQNFREVREVRARHESSEHARINAGPAAAGFAAARPLEFPRAAMTRAPGHGTVSNPAAGHGIMSNPAAALPTQGDFSRANRMHEIQRETESLRARQAGLQARQAELFQAKQAQQHRHEADSLQAQQAQDHLRQVEALQARQNQERRAQSDAARAAQLQEHRQQAEALHAGQLQAQRQQAEALRQRHEQEVRQHQDTLSAAAAERQRTAQAERSLQAQQIQAAEAAHRVQAAQHQNALGHQHAAGVAPPFVMNPAHLAPPGSPTMAPSPVSPFMSPAHGHLPQAPASSPFHQNLPQAPASSPFHQNLPQAPASSPFNQHMPQAPVSPPFNQHMPQAPPPSPPHNHPGHPPGPHHEHPN